MAFVGRSTAEGLSRERGRSFGSHVALDDGLFVAAIAIYLTVRLVGLTEFPIYFFSDEAIQTVTARDLLFLNFFGRDGVFLPTFFENGGRYNLSISVYLQVLPTLLFGESVFLTRAVAVLATLPAVLAVGLIVRNNFRLPHAWVAMLLLSATPAWFLHSRTAFETTLAVSLYAAGLYFYLSYRCRSPRAIHGAVTCFALAFYSYSPAQLVVVVTAVLLLVSDAPYHWAQRRHGLLAMLLAILLALPLLRFQVFQPESYRHAMQILSSYWLEPLPLSDKLARFGAEYLTGLDPRYWFGHQERDLVRHVMAGWGHLLPAAALPMGLGLAICLWHWRNPAYRLVLLSLLAAPTGAALAQILVTRALFMVIPATLLGAIGIAAMLSLAGRLASWLGWQASVGRSIAASMTVFAGLVGMNGAMLRDALVNGPTWYTDYGLYGMQWGARQVFTAVRDDLERDPGMTIMMSPTWTNGFDVLARFFLYDPIPVRIGTILTNVERKAPLDTSILYVMTAEEFDAVQASAKFTDVRIERVIANPAGHPAFYFVRLRYADNADGAFAAEAAARRKLDYETVDWLGQAVLVGHSAFDLGSVGDLFDNDAKTVARTTSANPLVLDLTFSTPRRLNSVVFRLGGHITDISIEAYPESGTDAVKVNSQYPGSDDTSDFKVDIDAAPPIKSLRLVLEQVDTPEPAHVHLWGVSVD